MALQARAYLQLTNGHIPDNRKSSVEEAHKCLSEALVSKTVLIVLDDCCESTTYTSLLSTIERMSLLKLLHFFLYSYYQHYQGDKQHAKCFDCIDTATPSKLLISTRISGLLKSSSDEVKLALMTNEEAIDLLAHGAGLDHESIPAVVLEVVGLCGRLPVNQFSHYMLHI